MTKRRVYRKKMEKKHVFCDLMGYTTGLWGLLAFEKRNPCGVTFYFSLPCLHVPFPKNWSHQLQRLVHRSPSDASSSPHSRTTAFLSAAHRAMVEWSGRSAKRCTGAIVDHQFLHTQVLHRDKNNNERHPAIIRD